jgi:hypothetical protein
VTARDSNALAAAPTAVPDTVTVATPKVVYRFSTVGAAPIGIQLNDYKALSATGSSRRRRTTSRSSPRLPRSPRGRTSRSIWCSPASSFPP